MFEVEQDGLVRLARSAVPAKKRRDVVNAEGQDQNDPFQPADATFHGLRDNLRCRPSRRNFPGGRFGMVDLNGKGHVRTGYNKALTRLTRRCTLGHL